MFSSAGSLVSFYIRAKKAVIAAGFGEEISAQESACLQSLTESRLLRETAWVILCSGMSERTIYKKFPALAEAFLQFNSSLEIVVYSSECFDRAIKIFGHQGKITAIIQAAELIAMQGFPRIKMNLIDNTVETLKQFSFVGPITVMHLAKNIGFVTAKEDRHLKRLASRAGFESADDLCAVISEYIGDRVDLVDTVLWRYSTLYGSKTIPVFNQSDFHT